MKNIFFILITLFFPICFYGQTDDVYYDPSKDTRYLPSQYDHPVQETNTKEEVLTPSNTNSDKTDGYSDNKALQYDPIGNSNTYQYKDGNSYITNNYFLDDEDYYDFFFTSRIRRYYRPTYGLSFWDPFYTNYYFYDWNPWSWGTSIYQCNPYQGWGNRWNNGWNNFGFGNSFWNDWNCMSNGWNNWGYWNNGWCGNNSFYYPYYGPVNNFYYGNNWNNGWYNAYWQGYRDGYQNNGWGGYPSWYWNQLADPGLSGPRYVNPGLQMPEGTNSGKGKVTVTQSNSVQMIDGSRVNSSINASSTNDIRIQVPVTSVNDIDKNNIPKEGYIYQKTTTGSVVQPSATVQPSNTTNNTNDRINSFESKPTPTNRGYINEKYNNTNIEKSESEWRNTNPRVQPGTNNYDNQNRNIQTNPNNNSVQKRDYNSYQERPSSIQNQPEKRNSNPQPSWNQPSNQSSPSQQRTYPSNPSTIKPQSAMPSNGGSMRPNPTPSGKR